MNDLQSRISSILSVYQMSCEDELSSILSNSSVDDDENTINMLNLFLQREVRTAIMKLMSAQQNAKISSLLRAITLSTANNSKIKKSLAIGILDNILQCMGVTDIKQILKEVSELIRSFGHLQDADQNRLLRVINYLLKRISKTEDYQIRGQLQFALTKILPVCHDSGFHYRTNSASVSKLEYQQGAYDNFRVQGITYEFYKQFWKMQQYFMDPNKLAVEEQELIIRKDESEQIKSDKKNKDQTLVLLRLRQIYQTLNDVLNYYRTHPTQLRMVNQPLKFLKNSNLLSLQLHDVYFRQTIMVQVIIFTYGLNNCGSRLCFTIGEHEKILIDKIQNIAKNFLENCDEPQNLYSSLQHILMSEKYWLDLKDHWRERKKDFFLRYNNVSQEKHKAEDFTKHHKQLKRQINEKMKIDGSNLRHFLSEPVQPAIESNPSSVSFSYFYSQAIRCLQYFDQENGVQNQFESRADYNMFQWKAMRSLYRQNLRAINANDNSNQKLKDYRMLNFLNKREDQFNKETNNDNQKEQTGLQGSKKIKIQ